MNKSIKGHQTKDDFDFNQYIGWNVKAAMPFTQSSNLQISNVYSLHIFINLPSVSKS